METTSWCNGEIKLSVGLKGKLLRLTGHIRSGSVRAKRCNTQLTPDYQTNESFLEQHLKKISKGGDRNTFGRTFIPVRCKTKQINNSTANGHYRK